MSAVPRPAGTPPRCPRCSARNAGTATWCTQCYGPLRVSDAAASDQAEAAGARPAAGRSDAGAPDGRSVGHDVRERDDGVEWRCGCGAWVALHEVSCPNCGTRRSGFGATAHREPVGTGAGRSAASALLPGLGHVLSGHTGAGIARCLLFGLWAAGSFALGGPGEPAGLTLGAGAVVLWTSCLVGVRRLSAGRADPLTTRGLTWLVVGVTGALVLVAVVAVPGL